MSTIELQSIHHVQVAMPPGHESEALDFYQGVLGLENVSKARSARTARRCLVQGRRR